jgi:hypothetical protein
LTSRERTQQSTSTSLSLSGRKKRSHDLNELKNCEKISKNIPEVCTAGFVNAYHGNFGEIRTTYRKYFLPEDQPIIFIMSQNIIILI